jgi:peptidyl-prolyl cis-trans isomerase SurA
MKRSILFAFSLFVCLATFAQPRKVVADRIVAQVGDKIILRSDIMNALADYKRQEMALPENAECAFLEGQLIQKALVLQAEKDSLTVSDEELDAQLNNRIRYFVQMYGSEQVLEDIAGKSIFQLKEDFKSSIKESMLSEQMRNKIVGGVKITPTEVRTYFNKIPKDSLPFYESELRLSEIIIYPKASKDLDQYEVDFLKELKQQVESGKRKFQQLVPLYTHDPGSKENGGEYTINRTEKLFDPAFVNAAFKLKDGQISNPFKSKFGWHIMQMVSRSGNIAVVRHILRIPQVNKEEIDLYKKKLDSVRSLVIAGKMTFGQAYQRFSEDENKFSSGEITGKDGSNYVTIDQLDKDMVLAIKDLKPGEISQPVAFVDEKGKNAVRIIYFQERTEPHRENLKDDYNRVSQRALEEKKFESLKKWFTEKIPTYYITIDKEFDGCKNIDDWHKAAAKK